MSVPTFHADDFFSALHDEASIDRMWLLGMDSGAFFTNLLHDPLRDLLPSPPLSQASYANDEPEPTQPSLTTTADPVTLKKKRKESHLPYAANLLNINFDAPSSLSSPASLDDRKAPKKYTGDRPTSLYSCDVPGCTKAFTRPYNLKSHQRTHTAERPFACTHCPKRFARQHDCSRHIKLHSGVKPYVCSQCNKTFARQDALIRHKRPNGKRQACSESRS